MARHCVHCHRWPRQVQACSGLGGLDQRALRRAVRKLLLVVRRPEWVDLGGMHEYGGSIINQTELYSQTPIQLDTNDNHHF